MRISVSTCGYALTLTLVLLAVAEAGRKRGNNGRNNGDRCRYDKKVEWGACDPETNTMSRTLSLKRGGATCEDPKTFTKNCGAGNNRAGSRCKYERVPWGACDETTNTKTRTLTLKEDQRSDCEATKTESRRCNNRNGGANNKDEREGGKNKAEGRRRKNKGKKFNCQYTVTNRSDCDVTTNTMIMTLTLHKGHASVCEADKTVTKECEEGAVDDENGCRYGNPEVSDCVDNQKTITKSLIGGDETTCDAVKTKTKRCGGGGGGRNGKRNGGGKKGGRKNRGGRKQKQQQQQQEENTEGGALV